MYDAKRDFEDVAVYTGVPTSTELAPAAPAHTGAVVSVEQSRAVAEAQAAMVIARSAPRDENAAYLKIIKACKRLSLAEQGEYAYKRGSKLVDGASIRLAEVMVRYWGNANYGFRELSRDRDESQVEAFAWDLETNVKATRTFTVRHWRDKTGGPQKLTQERDKYELLAGMAQRRVRACILQIIPGDIVEAARQQCKKTLAAGNGKSMEDRVRGMLEAFDEVGVTKDMVEAYLQHKITAIVPQQLVTLRQIFQSIRDGVAPREEFFKPQATTKKERLTSEPSDPMAGAADESYSRQGLAQTARSPEDPPREAEPGADSSESEPEEVDFWCEYCKKFKTRSVMGLKRHQNRCSAKLVAAVLKPAQEPPPDGPETPSQEPAPLAGGGGSPLSFPNVTAEVQASEPWMELLELLETNPTALKIWDNDLANRPVRDSALVHSLMTFILGRLGRIRKGMINGGY